MITRIASPCCRLAFLVIVSSFISSDAAGAQTAPRTGPATLARADSAYDSGNRELARTLYAEVLAQDSTQSRAVFRLAQLEPSDERALKLYRRYIALEPDDPWGHMAEGDLLARMGRWSEGLVAYEGAAAVAPGERDVTIGRSRLLERAGRPHLAAMELAAWTTQHPDDGEAWDQLGRSRMRSGRPRAAVLAFEHAARLDVPGAASRLRAALAAGAPAITPDAAALGDSDGNRTTTFGGSVDMMLGDGVRLAAGGRRHTITNDIEEVQGVDLLARLVAAPVPGVQLTVQGGTARFAGPASNADSWTALRIGTRLRVRAPAQGPSIDLRAERAPLGFSPLLIMNRVTRSEVRAIVEVPVAALRLRGTGRVGRFEAPGEPANGRSGAEGALVLPLGSGHVLPSVQYRLVGYQRASAAGYFAPRRAETVEGGVYIEFGEDGPLSIAADVGAGRQRVAEYRAVGVPGGPPRSTAPGPWSRVLRAWGQASLSLAPSRSWYVEVEAYDAPFALEGVATTGNWRFLSVSSGLRWALR